MTGARNVQREIVQQAVFVDRDEDGNLSVAEFAGHVAAPEQMRQLTALRKLTVSGTAVSDAFLQSIADLPDLVSVSLVDCSLRSGQLRLLNQARSLRELDLSGSSDASDDLPLLELPELQTLKLARCEWVNDESLIGLDRFPHLQALDLSETAVSDGGLTHLTVLTDLRWLDLAGCEGVGESALEVAGSLKRLQSLMLSARNLNLETAVRYRHASLPYRLFVPLRDFPELRPILERDRPVPGSASLYLWNDIRSLNIQDDVGLDYSALRFFPEIHSLSLNGPGVTDESLSFLPEMKQLTYLSFKDTSVTDLGLRHLSGLTGLRTLLLPDTQITDDGLRSLSKLPELSWLDLSGTAITDAGLEHLIGLQKLHYLDLRGVEMTRRGLELLTQMPELSDTLDLSSFRLASADLSLLEDKPFRSVDLSNQSLGQDDFDVIGTWSELRELNLSGTTVTGEELRLAGNSHLNSLLLDGTRTTDAGLAQADLPSSLCALSLAATSISGESLAELFHLRLSSLDLSATPLTEAGIDQAFMLRPTRLALKGIYLDVRLPAAAIGHGGVEWLELTADSPMLMRLLESEGAAKLGTLGLHRATGDHLSRLQPLRYLSTLRLYDGTFRKDSFRHLYALGYLRSLSLAGCVLTPDAVAEIAGLPQLGWLQIACPGVREEALQVLRDQNPELQIDYRNVPEVATGTEAP